MLKVGLTGNMGSGKSTVCKIFSILGVPVYVADEAAKNMYARPDVLNRVLELTGRGILDKRGYPDRKALAGMVFSNPALLSGITSIIHPLVREDFREWCRAFTDKPFVIQEAAIIFESGFENEYDKIIHVSCPDKLAAERIRNRDGYSAEEITRRRAFQWSDQRKSSLADKVIVNDGETLVIPQVLMIFNQLSA